MLNKIFTKPLKLEVGEQTVSFLSIADFGFCMSGRTSVPSLKITELIKHTTKQLRTEARSIKDIEKCFVSILSHSLEDPSSISRALKELDTSIFSNDHEWRSIISALNNSSDEFNPFRRIALVKYMQYLSSRQDIIKFLFSKKKKLEKKSEKQLKYEKQAEELLKETIIFEDNLFNPNSNNTKDNEFERVPKGESVIITLKPKEKIVVMLSKHRCAIEMNEQAFFIDQKKQKHVLDKKYNIIGRNASGSIVIDPSLKDISRVHLVIESLGDNILQLTDLSAHGTYIPSALLADHSC